MDPASKQVLNPGRAADPFGGESKTGAGDGEGAGNDCGAEGGAGKGHGGNTGGGGGGGGGGGAAHGEGEDEEDDEDNQLRLCLARRAAEGPITWVRRAWAAFRDRLSPTDAARRMVQTCGPFHDIRWEMSDYLNSTPGDEVAEVVRAFSNALNAADLPLEVLASSLATYCVVHRRAMPEVWSELHALSLPSHPMEWFATIYPPSLIDAFAGGCFATHMEVYHGDYDDHKGWILRFTLAVLTIMCPDGTWRGVALAEGHTALLELDSAAGAS